MLYVNISGERKLICSKREKVWVDPRGIVDVEASDMKFNGPNISVLMLKNKYDKIKAIARSKRKRRNIKLAAIAAAKLVAKKIKKKSLIKNKIATVVEKVVKKKVEKVLTAAELKILRATLKKALELKNKNNLMSFGNEVLSLNIKQKDNKGTIITTILNAAKSAGYSKIIKKV